MIVIFCYWLIFSLSKNPHAIAFAANTRGATRNFINTHHLFFYCPSTLHENIVAFVIINAGYRCRHCQEFLLNSVIQVVRSSKTELCCAALDKFLSTSKKRKTIHKNVGFIQCFYKEPRGFSRILPYALLLRLIDSFLDVKDFW